MIGAAAKKFVAWDEGKERLCRTPKSGLASATSTDGRARPTIGFSTFEASWSEQASVSARTTTAMRPRFPRSRKRTPSSTRSGILNAPGLERALMIGSSHSWCIPRWMARKSAMSQASPTPAGV